MIHFVFWRCHSHWHYPSGQISQIVFIIFNNFVFEGSTGSSIVRHQLSVRAEQLANLKFLKTAVRSNIPKQPLPTPSKILMLGRSIALPRPQHNGTVLQFALKTQCICVTLLWNLCQMPRVTTSSLLLCKITSYH